MGTAEFLQTRQVPVSQFLRQTLEEREIEHAKFAKDSGVGKLRVQSILAGGVYQLELHEIISFARALRIDLDFFYLLVKKETPDFVRIVSRKTGMVLSEPHIDFEGKMPPTTFKQLRSPFGEKIASYKTRWNLKTDIETARALNVLPETYKDYLHKRTLPYLDTFYEICHWVESKEKRNGKSREELIAERKELYFARNPKAKKLDILNPAETKLVIHLPELEGVEWSYQSLRQTTFGSVLDRIIHDVVGGNSMHPELSDREREKIKTQKKIAKRIKIKPGIIQDLLVDGMLEIDWPFIEQLAQFVNIQMAGMYHPTFLATAANPIILDLADEIVDQRGRIIRPAGFDEPFDFEYRYGLRLKLYKGKDYKAKRK